MDPEPNPGGVFTESPAYGLMGFYMGNNMENVVIMLGSHSTTSHAIVRIPPPPRPAKPPVAPPRASRVLNRDFHVPPLR